MMSRTHFLRSALSTLGRTTTVGGGAARSPCLTPLTPALRFLADDSEIKAATLKRDRDMGAIWILQDAELEAIWDKAHDKSEAHSTPFVVEEVVRLTINKQREKLSADMFKILVEYARKASSIITAVGAARDCSPVSR